MEGGIAVSYGYEYPSPEWFWKIFGVHHPWSNPHTDVGQERRVDTTRVGSSVPVDWPAEYANLKIDFDPPRQTPWKGSVSGGHPVQAADPTRTKKVRVRNRWGGTLIEDGVDTGRELRRDYSVRIARPARERDHGWAWQGYPNPGASGDRHLYLVWPDGTVEEMIGFYPDVMTCEHYARYGPDGEVLHRIDPGGSVVKANLQWTRLALNRGDTPHRMGLVFHELGDEPDHSIPDGIERWNLERHKSDGIRADFAVPRYGQWFRLSDEAHRRLIVGANLEQRMVLDGANEHGFLPVDRGGSGWEPGPAMISGAQWDGSTLGDLQIRVADLERVTEAAA